MALLLNESFDFYGYTDRNCILDSRTFSSTSLVSINATAGRRSSPCIDVSLSSLQQGAYWGVRFDTDHADGTLGVALYMLYASTNNGEMIRVRSAAGATQFCLDVTNDGRLRVKTAYNGSVLAQSAAGAMSFGIFQFLEVQFTCDGTDSVQAWVDGVEVIPLTGGLNLRQSGAGGFGQLLFGNFGEGHTYWDDLRILDSTGDAPFNDRLGDWKQHGHLPTADGDDADWAKTAASYYDSINDVGGGYATHYITGDAVGERVSVKITPGDMTTIQGVEVVAYGRNPGGGTVKVKPYVLISGTRYYGDEIGPLSDTADKIGYLWKKNPATDSAWTKTAILPANAQFGWEVTVCE